MAIATATIAKRNLIRKNVNIREARLRGGRETQTLVYNASFTSHAERRCMRPLTLLATFHFQPDDIVIQYLTACA